MPQQLAQDEAGHIWEVDDQGNVLRLHQPASSGPQPFQSTAPNPSKVLHEKADATTAAAQAPFAGRLAAAQASKAATEAEKARRDLAASMSTVSPEQQKAQSALSNDEVIRAIGQARDDVYAGRSAGYWARLGKIPGVGGLVEPTNSINLRNSLSTIASRLTLDKLAQLKQASPTGASGLGSLTEQEGELLRNSVAGIGQDQGPERLIDNLAKIERHYRNFMALANGEDYRNPKVAEKYGILSGTSGKQGGDDYDASGTHPSLDPNAQTSQTLDPALRGVNSHVRGMIASGRKADDIVSYLNKISPGKGDLMADKVRETVAFRAQNPRTPIDRYAVQLELRDIPMSGLRQNLNKLAQSPVGGPLIAAGDAATGFNLANFTGNPELSRAAMDQIQNANPASIAGTLGGGAAAGAALEGLLPFGGAAAAGRPLIRGIRAAVADGVYGGVSAYGNSDGSPWDVIKGIGTGILGGGAGRAVVRGAGGAARGFENPDAQVLRQAGVPLTIGQAGRGSGPVGNALAVREDRMAGFPGIGEKINRQRRNGLFGFNGAINREGMAPITDGPNPLVTPAQPIGIAEAGVDQMRALTGGAYTNTLAGVNVTPDQPFMGAYGAARQAGAGIPRTGPEFEHMVDTRVEPFVQRGNMTGREIQDILQGVRGANFGTDSMGTDASAAFNRVGTAVEDLVGRQAPDVIPNLQRANQAYRNLNIIADATGRAANTGGIPTPAQLGMAARANATKFQGKLGAASESRPFFELQRAGQNVLPSTIPDSGTAGRAEAGRGIFGAMRGAARNAVNGPLYSDALQPLIEALALQRPDLLRRIGSQVQDRAGIGGKVAVPLAIGAAYQQQ